MRQFELRRDWVTEAGFRAIVIMTDIGFHCGYVGVAPGHPLHGADYDRHSNALGDAPSSVFDVHGWLTFSGERGGSMIEENDLWWFGFDCGHCGDAPSPEYLEKMQQEYPDSSFMWEHVEGVFRDVDYCVAECESLARQIADAAQGQEEA